LKNIRKNSNGLKLESEQRGNSEPLTGGPGGPIVISMSSGWSLSVSFTSFYNHPNISQPLLLVTETRQRRLLHHLSDHCYNVANLRLGKRFFVRTCFGLKNSFDYFFLNTLYRPFSGIFSEVKKDDEKMA